jgi:hypothetical protein
VLVPSGKSITLNPWLMVAEKRSISWGEETYFLRFVYKQHPVGGGSKKGLFPISSDVMNTKFSMEAA